VIRLSGALSPHGHEERTSIGSGAIPVSLASEVSLFLRQDLQIGIQSSLRRTPREILEDAKRNREWFKGIVLSAAFFEHFGSVILEKRTRGGINNKKLKLDLYRILRLLLDFRIVSEEIHSYMDEIEKERNKLAHEPFQSIDEARSRRLIENAIRCLEALGVADQPST
jgi:hypothetical protein